MAGDYDSALSLYQEVYDLDAENAIAINNIGEVYEAKNQLDSAELFFLKAVEIAFKEDSNVLVEEYLDGIEISVGVISFKNEIICLPITEIVSDNDFFDYEAKYNGQSQEITPARISDDMTKSAIIESKKIYSILKLRGFSRSEFIFKSNIPYLLEVNTVPGLTKQSILPQQLKLAGIELEDLFDNAIEEAIN